MKYFGAYTDDLDLVPKSYVNGVINFDPTADIENLNPVYKDHLVLLRGNSANNNTVGFLSLPQAGQSFDVYVRPAETQDESLQVTVTFPETINSKIAIIDGVYPNFDTITLGITRTRKTEDFETTHIEGIVIHIFFDGNMFFLSRHYYDAGASGKIPQ